MSVKAEPRFEAERIPRAQADGEHFRLCQERSRKALGIGGAQRNLEAILAGVARPADDRGRAGNGEISKLHEAEIGHARRMA